MKIEFENTTQIRESIAALKKVSGIYRVNFPNGKNYIGQTEDLYQRLSAHIGNMEPKNMGIDSPGHRQEKDYFDLFQTYTLHIYKAPVSALNVYEDFMVWKYGSFSQTKIVRYRRNDYNRHGNHPEDFNFITSEEWLLFTQGGNYHDIAIPQHLFRKKKEKDYGF